MREAAEIASGVIGHTIWTVPKGVFFQAPHTKTVFSDDAPFFVRCSFWKEVAFVDRMVVCAILFEAPIADVSVFKFYYSLVGLGVAFILGLWRWNHRNLRCIAGFACVLESRPTGWARWLDCGHGLI